MQDADREYCPSDAMNQPMSADAVSLVNAVCSGRSVEFTCQFIECVPDILSKVRELGWNDPNEPPAVIEGNMVEVIAAVNELMAGSDLIVMGEKPRVMTGVYYANQCKINFDGFMVDVTGWVHYSSPGVPYIIERSKIKGWQLLPVW